jgi:GTPase SAR1 family protein
MIAMDIYELSNFGTQEAFFPLLLLLLGGGAIGGIIAAFWSSDKIGLAVLGMAGAGKTTFYNHLRNEWITEKGGTGIRPLNEFSVKLKDGKEIIIKKGQDVGGLESFIPQYESMMEKANIVLFFFDAYKYLTDIQYARYTNARIDFINGKMTDKKILRTVISYADMFSDRNQAITDIINSIGDKYDKFFFDPRNYYFVNLTDKREIQNLVNNLFATK